MAKRNQSKFVTDGVADDPLVQGPRFEMDADDRQYIDNQIIGLQKHIIDHPGGGGSTLTADTFAWTPPTATTDENETAVAKYVDTTDNTPAQVTLFTHVDETMASYAANVIGRSEDGQHFEVDIRYALESTAGSFTEPRPSTNSNELTGNPASWSAALTRSGSTVRATLVGDATSPTRFCVQASRAVVKKTVSIPAFDIADLALTGWIDGPGYDDTTHVFAGKASAGTSGSHDFTTAGTPGTGTINALQTATFNGTSQHVLYAAGSEAVDLVDNTAWTVSFVGRINSSDNDDANPYANGGLGGSSDANWNIGLSSANEIEAYQFASANKIAASTWAAGTLVCIQARYDGTNISVRKGKGAWTNTASGNPAITGTFKIFTNYNATKWAGAELCEYLITDVALSDSDLDSVADAHAARWGVSV